MTANGTPQNPDNGRRLTARRARAARGRVATYIHEVSERHGPPAGGDGAPGKPIEEPQGN
jgi:hypothetical protein